MQLRDTKRANKTYTKAFALPTILIASLVMTMVMLVSVQAASSVSSALRSQYYSKLAQEASKAGEAKAAACLAANSGIAQWSDEKPLKPNTDCLGNVDGGLSAYVLTTTNPTVRTTFSIGEPLEGVSMECEDGYIPAPGNATLGVSAFCVSQYEIKNVGGKPVSQASGTPWVNLNQIEAISISKNACPGCELISQDQWMSIAIDAANISSNWVSGTIGSGSMYRGHSDSSPGNALEAGATTDYYYGTGQASGEQRRTLNLSTGAEIWDLAGNVTEWVNTKIASGKPGSGSPESWREWNAISSAGTPDRRPQTFISAASGWTSSTNGIGTLYSNSADTGSKSMRRGGHWSNGANAGVFSMAINTLATDNNSSTGFRIVAPGRPPVTATYSVTSNTELVSTSGGSVWRSYKSQATIRGGSGEVVGNTVFGYTAQNDSANDGAYFITVASSKIKGVGVNTLGQLGIGNTTNTSLPQSITISGKVIDSVYVNFVAESWNTFFITDDQYLYATGEAIDGALGNNSTSPSVRSSPVTTFFSNGTQVGADSRKPMYVSPLGKATFLLASDNKLYSTGLCQNGIIGRSCSSNQTRFGEIIFPSSPSVRMANDYYTAFNVLQNGALYGWGLNNYGQLARGTTTTATTPVKISTYGDSGQPRAVQVATDADSLYVIGSDGSVKAAGRNNYGQLGDGSTTQRTSLVTFNYSANCTGSAIKVVSDQWSAFVLTDTGQVCGAGLNASGLLGDGSTTNRSTPVKFSLPGGVTAVDVYTSASGMEWGDNTRSNTYVVGSDGKVYAAGDNDYGQLGRGTIGGQSATPAAMNVIDGTIVRAIQARGGYGTSVILTNKGVVYTVGNNSNGQLGDGTTTNNGTPGAHVYTNTVVPLVY